MPKLTNSVLYLMSISAGMVAANLYYSQPLLNQIADTFGETKSAASNVVLTAQMGYAIGMLIIIPLGDMVPNMKILKADFALMIVSLVAAAFAPTLWVLVISCLFMGISCATPQFFVPMASQLAHKENRGRAIGVMMTGLLSGIIGGRVISGFVGDQLGWRAMYGISSGAMLILFLLLYIKLPRLHPHYGGTYGKLLKSMKTIFITQPAIRVAIIRGGLSFAGLTAMWTTVVFVLNDSFGYGATIAGLFGLFGIIGALGANITGKLNDKYPKKQILITGFLVSLLSWVIFYFSTYSKVGLAIGIILVDLGQQIIHITNQNIILPKIPEAQNRINTIYMVSFFACGALGATLGTTAYVHFGWKGVSLLGGLLVLFLWGFHFIFRKRAY